MRVDGRLNASGFHVIELSPDIYLGSDGELVAAATTIGLDYHGLIRLLLENAVESGA